MGLPAQAEASPVPDDWFMDDGIGVGLRTTGAPCSEMHVWASSGGRWALWCNPRTGVWEQPR
ncbi:hypothetical protein AU193_22380 [Mycobacterium sp. GA-1285]|nr:hypothetical protein AU193_22380 [Mycobacterium sp. GA-1285]